MPPPTAGELYVALFLSSVEVGPLSRESDRTIDEVIGFTITITRRIGYVPSDRRTSHIIVETDLSETSVDEPRQTSMEKLARQIVAVVLKNRHDLCLEANALLQTLTERSGTIDNGLFVEPVRWLGTDAEPRDVGPDWFTANPDDTSACGFALDIRFGELRRIHNVSTME